MKEGDKHVQDEVDNGMPLWATTRQVIRKIALSKSLDWLVTIAIVANCFVLALADYSNVNSEGDLSTDGSWQNSVVANTEYVFTTIFTGECVIKIIGFGFYGPGSYLSDRWNWLDFLVVISGLVSFTPNVPNMSAIRTLRVLRPLKMISKSKGLKVIIKTISDSLSSLMSVVILLTFIFMLAGIGGVELFSGPALHTRCRLTPYPVNTSWTAAVPYEDFSLYRCLDESNANLDSSDYDKSSSPWSRTQDCIWPVDEEETSFCTFSDTEGLNECPHDTSRIPVTEWRWCGSNYDGYGNPRFKDKRYMKAATFIGDLNYGYTVFDNLGYAFLTIFQCVTMEGWTDIMHQVQDSVGVEIGTLYFVILELVAGFFLVNLFLAVLSSKFEAAQSDTQTDDGSSMNEDGTQSLAVVVYESRPVVALRSCISKCWSSCTAPIVRACAPSEATRAKLKDYRARTVVFVEGSFFSTLILSCILMNVLCLAMDHYPEITTMALVLESMNFLFTIIFTAEMLLKLFGYGYHGYVAEPFNVLDGFVVIASLIEFGVTPPQILGGSANSTGGALTSLRCLRAFRVLKAVKKWKKLQELLVKITIVVGSSSNFLALLCIFLFVCTIIGMIFFANRFRFDEEGYPLKSINSYEWKNAYDRPRSNFDDLSHALMSVFQILTTENWNTIMYDSWRCCGPQAIIFPILVIIVGNYFLVNLFLAMVLGGFRQNPEDVAEMQAKERADREKAEKEEELHNIALVVLPASPAPRTAAASLSLLPPRPDSSANSRGSPRGSPRAAGDGGSGEKTKKKKHRRRSSASGRQLKVTHPMNGKAKGGSSDALYSMLEEGDDSMNSSFNNGNNSNSRNVSPAPHSRSVTPNYLRAMESGGNSRSPSPLTPGIVVVVGGGGGGGGGGEGGDIEMHQLYKNNAEEEDNICEGINGSGKNLADGEQQQQQHGSQIDECSIVATPDTRGLPSQRPSFSRALASIKDGSVRAFDKLTQDNPDDDSEYDDELTVEEVQDLLANQEVNPGKMLRNAARKTRMLWRIVRTAVCGTPPGAEDAAAYEEAKQQDEREEETYLADIEKGQKKEDTDKHSNVHLIPTSLYIFGPTNTLRIVLAKCIQWRWFEPIITVVILISCITLAMDNPLLNPDSQFVKNLSVANLIVLSIFMVEMAMKIIVFGVFSSPSSYLRDGWTQFDTFVVATSLIDVFANAGGGGLRSLRVLRALRALRPLRLINKSGGMKAIVNTLLACMAEIGHVLVLCVLFYFVFAVVGMTYFKGGLRSCHGHVYNDVISVNSSYMELLMEPVRWNKMTDFQKGFFGANSAVLMESMNGTCRQGAENSWPLVDSPCCWQLDPSVKHPTSMDVCKCWGGTWSQQNGVGFDNVIQAFFTLLKMSTTEGWVDTTYAMVDDRGEFMQPERDYSVGWIYFCIIFMLVGGYFAMNMFVGVVVENFRLFKAQSDEEEEEAGHDDDLDDEAAAAAAAKRRQHKKKTHAFMTPEQMAWAETRSLLTQISPKVQYDAPPEDDFLRNFCFSIADSFAADIFLNVCIVANTILMACQYFGQGDYYGNVLYTGNLIFSCIFTVEIMIKYYAFRNQYFIDSMNKFDIILVVIIDLGYVLSWTIGSNVSRGVSVLRMMRLFRLIKLVAASGSVARLIDTIVQTLPAIGNLSILMIFLLFMFTVMGVIIFAKVEYGEYYNEHVNFRDFGTAFVSLIGFSTGEAWDYVLNDMAGVGQANCVNDPEYNPDMCGFSNHVGCIPLNGCGTPLAYPYMLLFNIIISLVFINLFLGIVLEGFDSAKELAGAIAVTDIELFRDHWAKFDPQGSFFITTKQLEDFVFTLPGGLLPGGGSSVTEGTQTVSTPPPTDAPLRAAPPLFDVGKCNSHGSSIADSTEEGVDNEKISPRALKAAQVNRDYDSRRRESSGRSSTGSYETTPATAAAAAAPVSNGIAAMLFKSREFPGEEDGDGDDNKEGGEEGRGGDDVHDINEPGSDSEDNGTTPAVSSAVSMPAVPSSSSSSSAAAGQTTPEPPSATASVTSDGEYAAAPPFTPVPVHGKSTMVASAATKTVVATSPVPSVPAPAVPTPVVSAADDDADVSTTTTTTTTSSVTLAPAPSAPDSDVPVAVASTETTTAETKSPTATAGRKYDLQNARSKRVSDSKLAFKQLPGTVFSLPVASLRTVSTESRTRTSDPANDEADGKDSSTSKNGSPITASAEPPPSSQGTKTDAKSSDSKPLPTPTKSMDTAAAAAAATTTNSGASPSSSSPTPTRLDAAAKEAKAAPAETKAAVLPATNAITVASNTNSTNVDSGKTAGVRRTHSYLARRHSQRQMMQAEETSAVESKGSEAMISPALDAVVLPTPSSPTASLASVAAATETTTTTTTTTTAAAPPLCSAPTVSPNPAAAAASSSSVSTSPRSPLARKMSYIERKKSMQNVQNLELQQQKEESMKDNSDSQEQVAQPAPTSAPAPAAPSTSTTDQAIAIAAAAAEVSAAAEATSANISKATTTITTADASTLTAIHVPPVENQSPTPQDDEPSFVVSSGSGQLVANSAHLSIPHKDDQSALGQSVSAPPRAATLPGPLSARGAIPNQVSVRSQASSTPSADGGLSSRKVSRRAGLFIPVQEQRRVMSLRSAGRFSTRKQARKFIEQLHIRVFDGQKVHFRDVLLALSTHLLKAKNEGADVEAMASILEVSDDLLMKEHHNKAVESKSPINRMRNLSMRVKGGGSNGKEKEKGGGPPRKMLTTPIASIKQDYAARVITRLFIHARTLRRRKERGGDANFLLESGSLTNLLNASKQVTDTNNVSE